ncbi:hypothetical protein ASPZODRAFT_130828 [Penicilliopsis zonata CBS 506.65]|uniref:Plus3 domain-containing protein n=1 Tax=Penicilliopsis zonata CBS 506.65 TaxID=1073090 RepID=A0A1L9SNB5_9EURO|nr:hypothetical protein ASPZODRAFT_130828 [Penicilliopsis zonata CBS 506.65]OJJ48715.1 hypothetical protein ASPZODRAFT_130828 [Penicilliopsis zonata CBS 506.65]
MADDLDAELLALAGDSSDEESSPPPKETADSPVSSHASEHSPEPGEAVMARKGTAKPVRRSRKAKRDYEEAEDGELSSAASHHSLQSASMSESESESDGDGPADDDGPLFAYDKLYHSAKDKAEIMALPEIQREQILSERAHEVDRHNQDLALRRLLASREREEARQAKKNKRKASLAGLEEGQRKSSRQKTTLGGRKVGETSDAIEAYKRQRQQKGKRDEIRRRDAASREARHREKDGEVSDVDAEGESEPDWDERADRTPSPPKDDPPAELRDIERARVGRTNFAQVCFYPRFEEAISGCYTRASIGPNSEGLNEYRVCLIKRFTEGRPYAMDGPNGRPFITSQYAVLAHGKAEREFPFIACSESSFTEAEFNRYRQTMAVEDCKMATKSTVAKKVADINRLLSHQFTKDELNEKLRKQGSLDTKMDVFRRLDLENKLMSAKAAGDDAEVDKLQLQLRDLAAPKLAFGTSMSKPKVERKTEQERLAELNFRNRKLNYENVRRAQLEEKKASRKVAAAVARGEAPADPFMRVKTRAKTHYDMNEKATDTPTPETSHAGTPANGAETPGALAAAKRSDTLSSSQKKATKGGVAMIRHRNMDDENIAALDIDIDIDI